MTLKDGHNNTSVVKSKTKERKPYFNYKTSSLSLVRTAMLIVMSVLMLMITYDMMTPTPTLNHTIFSWAQGAMRLSSSTTSSIGFFVTSVILHLLLPYG